ncbi:uncharacterized protein LOC110183854 [Drosophila serrata]|uniref:uncharacterized protein LOC110183854 n=1 Tax=Drosophila serrata TaxID=7274 RepID=UPI000A1D35FC|nr:uncharacterized protein LOC110183854 [Drosophila serrata]
MCSKRSLSVLADTEDEQENPPKNTSKSLCQHTSREFTGSPKAKNVLGDSLSRQRRNKISKFEESWLALNKSCMGQSLMDASKDTSWTSSLSTKARTKALPISTYQSSPRTPPAISRSSFSSTFQTSRRWNTLMSEESCRKSPLASPLMTDKSPQILSSSFKTSRLWSKLIGEESSQTISYNSPKTSPLIEKSNEIPRRLSSSLKTSQRWNDLMSDHSLNESSCTDDSHVESSPVIRLVPDQPSQYLPSSSQKRVIPKSHIRAVKGGYADSFQRLLKSVRMDQRHLSSREPTHSGHVLAITEEFNVTMALVETESQQCSPSSSFNIILQSKQSKNVKVGSKVQFYLNPKIKPLELTNKQLVYCQPHNVIVL